MKRWLYLVLGFTLIILSFALAVVDLTILKTGAITPFIPLIIALLGVMFLDIYRRYPRKILREMHAHSTRNQRVLSLSV